MAKKATLETSPNSNQEISRPLTKAEAEEIHAILVAPQPTPVETVTPATEIKIEFKQESYKDIVRFTKVFENLTMGEAAVIHAALIANQDKQPETKIFLFLRALEEVAINTSRATFKD